MKYQEMFAFNDNDAKYIILKMIKPYSNVLEFGCANGNMTSYMKEQMGCRVCIVEYEKEAFDQAVKYAEDGICDDILNYTWLHRFEYKFDYVIFSDVLEHLLYPQEVLEKVQDVLEDHGSVLISVPNIAHHDIILNLYNNDFNYTPTGLLDDTHIHFFTENSLEKCCIEAGYVVVNRMHTVYEAGHTEQGIMHAPLMLKNKLKERKNGNVYQNIVELKTKNFCCEHGIKTADRHVEEEKIISKIYFDFGEGFHEEEITAVASVKNENGEYVCDYRMNMIPGLVAVRFDPVEEQGCIIKEFKASADGVELKCRYPNSLKAEDIFLEYSDDPIVEITGITEDADRIDIRAVLVLEGTTLYLDNVKKVGAIIQKMADADEKESIKRLNNIEKTCEQLLGVAEKYERQIAVEQSLCEKDRMIADLIQQIRRLEAQVERTGKEIRAAELSLCDKDRMIADYQEEKEEMIQQIQRLEAQVERTGKEMSVMKSSLVWKITHLFG